MTLADRLREIADEVEALENEADTEVDTGYEADIIEHGEPAKSLSRSIREAVKEFGHDDIEPAPVDWVVQEVTDDPKVDVEGGRESVERAVEDLRKKGEVYEPTPNKLRIVR